MRPERLYLTDMVEAAEAITDFIAGLDEAGFYQDSKSQSAVLQKLIVIGEAAARLSPEFRARYPQIEWQDIIAFRNILVHAYFSIKLDIVWEAATRDVPELQQTVVKILNGLSEV
ncbi:MAG: DUF86 domain-containing protein [Anaerolineae bacterium]